MMNIINGGSHSDATIAFQEFMIRPVSAPCFREGLRMGADVFHALKKVLKGKGLSTAVGDEGGFAPNFTGGTEEAIESIKTAVEDAGYVFGEFEGDGGAKRTSAEMADYLAELTEKYPIDSIEDGMDENDWDGWKLLTEKIGDKIQLVGDDLFVTNTKFLKKGIDTGCASSLLL